jgi:hypothetical protein
MSAGGAGQCPFDADTHAPMLVIHRHLLRLLTASFSKPPPIATGANSRPKLPARPVQTFAPSTIQSTNGMAEVTIFPRVGSKLQELDGPEDTINGTTTWTTLQSLSRTYVQINYPTTLFITYFTCLVYSQANSSSEISKVLLVRGRERGTYEIGLDLSVSEARTRALISERRTVCFAARVAIAFTGTVAPDETTNHWVRP